MERHFKGAAAVGAEGVESCGSETKGIEQEKGTSYFLLR
jgi:hypothetical protein